MKGTSLLLLLSLSFEGEAFFETIESPLLNEESISLLLLHVDAFLFLPLPVLFDFLFFAAFLAIQYFWLHQSFFQFLKGNGLGDGGLLFAPFSAAILIALAGVIVFFDKFIVIRLRAKTYPEKEKDESE